MDSEENCYFPFYKLLIAAVYVQLFQWYYCFITVAHKVSIKSQLFLSVYKKDAQT